MPKVRFTETRIVNDEKRGTSEETKYEEGEVYDMPLSSCERWIKRGFAEMIEEEKEPKPEVKVKETKVEESKPEVVAPVTSRAPPKVVLTRSDVFPEEKE